MASGRKASTPVQPSAPDAASESVRHTALPPQPEEENVASLQDDISQVSGDPIQQLFTTLGKFHRQLNKAQHAPDGEGWCDECMNELMAGLEISIAREWTPIKDALIDTARILHSYEQAGKAGQCVIFLKDSYELLSLMVGDLIVDTVRAGVKQKWREHYAQAVEELEARGITLVEDDDREVVTDSTEESATDPPEPSQDAAAPAPEFKTEKEGEVEEAKEQAADEAPEEEASAASQDETPETVSQKLAAELDDLEFDLPPLSDELSGGSKDQKPPKPGDIVPFPSTMGEEDTPYEEVSELDILEKEDLLKLDGVENKENPTAAPEETLKKRDTDAENGSEQAKCDSRASEEAAAESETQQAETEKATEEEPPTDELPPEETTDEIVHETPEHKADVGGEPAKPTASPEKTPPTQESKAAGKDKEDAAALLQRVQAAITSGDTRNTKTMALELAVAMARLEYEQVRQDLAEIEQNLLENGRIIEQGEAKVTQMENDLLRAEELLAARDGEHNANRERITAIDEELSALSAELAAIDAEIAALQQKRVEQENRIQNKKAEQQEATDEESRTQTEQEALSQETDSIRENLEKARTDVHKYRAERRDIELEIIKIKEEMEARHQSLSIIENTLYPGNANLENTPEGDTLL